MTYITFFCIVVIAAFAMRDAHLRRADADRRRETLQERRRLMDELDNSFAVPH